ncbi:hypothetical protein M413DRAFT_441138 [Hebeloma cylindrosporum]|uniref:Protein kinase domain-containing protein n=1 Tax=Hebeloma cylindrosporum TaxID=76867 RepID=A0A0C3CQD1_HEBCY|nr:hypothetical protein M413DRAFT_441138 [Hebeloma cylindrosporum h7]
MGRIAATELMPDFSGRVLNHGRLRLLESLGSGAYGKVYRAMDFSQSASRPRYYAVKCLNKPEPNSHADLLQQREFSLHKLVSGHPNIVTFHQFFSDDRFVYVTLDLCTGGDLFAAITEKHLFHNNGRLIKTAFIQLIDAVQYCHDLGVFHRDIKPENVLCSNDGTDIRLADFGLSIQSAVCQDFGCGSSYYMSPECIGREITTGKYSTRHNDVWALGVILTNMITGRNPWRYATADDDCFAAYLHDNNFLRQVLPISDGVNTVLKRIFTINPLRRISLPALRYQILELNAFFEKDLASTTSTGARIPRHTASQDDTIVSSNNPSETSESSDEIYVFASPRVDPPVQGLDTGQFILCESSDVLSVPSTASSGSSGPESEGPITPETYPVEPAVDVPDISEEEGLGQPADLAAGAFTSKFKTPANAKPKKPKGHLFRTAVQRIRGRRAASTS